MKTEDRQSLGPWQQQNSVASQTHRRLSESDNREIVREDEYKSFSSLAGNSDYEDKYNKWSGIDISYNIDSTTQFSFFYGSQKGGLVCANGVCAVQPGFDNGIKLTFRRLF